MTNSEKYSDLFQIEKGRIDDMISNGTLHSLRSIKKHVYKLYQNGSLINVFLDPIYGVDAMIKDLLSSYIIHCAVKQIVPEIGLDKE